MEPPSLRAPQHRCVPTTLFLPALVLSSCAGSPSATTGTEARSTLVRVATPSVPLADTLQLASDNRAFAVDLHHALGRATPGNLVFSPISISIALAML